MSEPTPDELAGIAWWNGLTDVGRLYWMAVAASAGDPTKAGAWEMHLRVEARMAKPAEVLPELKRR